MESLEAQIKEGYSLAMESAFQDLHQLVHEFRTVPSYGHARSDVKLKAIRDDPMSRIFQLEKAKVKVLTAPSVKELATVKAVPVPTLSSLRLKLPSYDGDILHWHDFFALFSALIGKEVSLTDHERCCHLLNSMTTPEDNSIVERAISITHSYEEAVECVQRSFERNRLIFGHHVKAIHSPYIFGDYRKDLLRMQGRLEQHVRGM